MPGHIEWPIGDKLPKTRDQLLLLYGEVVLLGLECVPNIFDLDPRVPGVVFRDNIGAKEILLPPYLGRQCPRQREGPCCKSQSVPMDVDGEG